MIITAARVLELNEEFNLITNLCEREQNNPEGVGFDIRFEEVYKLVGDGFLGITERKTPDIELVASVANGDKDITLKPGDYFLIKTPEIISSPEVKIDVENNGNKFYVVPQIFPRSTLQRCGLMLRATKTDPGYTGPLTFGIFNAGNSTIRLELNSRIANVVFQTATGELSRSYSGQWQGGRVAATKKETQN
ncbi:MAG: hypothetical protein HRU03_06125 [Nanoarchaeales archaeon]|nr:hypothetical protein [Nanoarchaeales archaeon]